MRYLLCDSVPAKFPGDAIWNYRFEDTVEPKRLAANGRGDIMSLNPYDQELCNQGSGEGPLRG